MIHGFNGLSSCMGCGRPSEKDQDHQRELQILLDLNAPNPRSNSQSKSRPVCGALAGAKCHTAELEIAF